MLRLPCVRAAAFADAIQVADRAGAGCRQRRRVAYPGRPFCGIAHVSQGVQWIQRGYTGSHRCGQNAG